MAERMLALGVRLDGNHTVACHGDGTPLRPDALTRWCKKHFGKLHTLRHSHASALLNAGISIKTVADRLGHQRVATTLETYAHTMPGADRDAAEKIDKLLSGSKAVANHR
jgi:integrase